MSNAGSYRINTPTITHQTIDGEVVLINMETGCYYSLQQSGAEIWQLLEAGANAETVTAQLANRYQAEPGQIASAVEKLLAELQQEAIVVPDASSAANGLELNGNSAEPPGKPFQAPVFEKFTDMQDLLLLDPIHEVADTGWPHSKETPPS